MPSRGGPHVVSAGLEPLEIVPELILCAGRNEAEMAAADAGCRALLGFYASTPAYRPVLETEDRGEVQAPLAELSRTGRWAEMGALIDDDLLAAICVRGTPADIAQQVRSRYSAHASRIAVYMPYQTPEDLLGELVDQLHAC